MNPALLAFLVVLALIFAFGLHYYSMEEKSFRVTDAEGPLTFNDAFFVSLNAQTLLGGSGADPRTESARSAVGFQSFTTLVILIWLAAY